MDVTGNQFFQFIAITYAAKADSALSLFEAQYSFFKKSFNIDHIEKPILRTAHTKSLPHTSNRHLLFMQQLLACSHLFIVHFKFKKYANDAT